MLLDDEENILKSLNRTLRRFESWDVEAYTLPEDAFKRAQSCIFDVIISDYHMPNMNGVEFLSEIKKLQPDAMRILLTGHVDINVLLDALNTANAFRFIPKPWNDDALITIIDEALMYKDIISENKMLAAQVKEQRNELNSLKGAKNAFEIHSNKQRAMHR
jgi:hypothetical protein